ncbi:hypothetical protein PABG_12372 [Paracoccidioides brasiliensis Pb03]|nr:hypothetical protein PABG_12372 [Paracoccidioides brasiliensis Pb03]
MAIKPLPAARCLTIKASNSATRSPRPSGGTAARFLFRKRGCAASDAPEHAYVSLYHDLTDETTSENTWSGSDLDYVEWPLSDWKTSMYGITVSTPAGRVTYFLMQQSFQTYDEPKSRYHLPGRFGAVGIQRNVPDEVANLVGVKLGYTAMFA